MNENEKIETNNNNNNNINNNNTNNNNNNNHNNLNVIDHDEDDFPDQQALLKKLQSMGFDEEKALPVLIANGFVLSDTVTQLLNSQK